MTDTTTANLVATTPRPPGWLNRHAGRHEQTYDSRLRAGQRLSGRGSTSLTLTGRYDDPILSRERYTSAAHHKFRGSVTARVLAVTLRARENI